MAGLFVLMSHCTWWPRPASFLLLGGWIWCRLTRRGRSLWRAPPACQPPGRSLNQETESGTSTTLRWGERSPRAPSPCTNPPPCNPQPPHPASLHQQQPPNLKTPCSGRLGVSQAEDIILHWQIILRLHHNVWKSLLLHMQDIRPAERFMEFMDTVCCKERNLTSVWTVLFKEGNCSQWSLRVIQRNKDVVSAKTI